MPLFFVVPVLDIFLVRVVVVVVVVIVGIVVVIVGIVVVVVHYTRCVHFLREKANCVPPDGVLSETEEAAVSRSLELVRFLLESFHVVSRFPLRKAEVGARVKS